jgi:hypothetical protein
MVLFGGDGGAVHFIVDRRVNKGGVDPYLKRGRTAHFHDRTDRYSIAVGFPRLE